jgi:hypothetical protein
MRCAVHAFSGLPGPATVFYTKSRFGARISARRSELQNIKLFQ